MFAAERTGMTGPRTLILLATALAAFLAHPQTGPAQAQLEVDLALVLAVDVSNSMDRAENALQRAGYVDALSHRDIWSAIRAGPLRRIALTYVEWAGPEEQRTVVPWRLIDSPAAARAFAAELADRPILFARGTGTSISAAIAYSVGLFRDSRYAAHRQVIDLSGDGPNNRGGPVTEARDAGLAVGVTINGLPLMLRPSRSFDAVDLYYRDCVIGGPGAFVLPVYDDRQLGQSIRRKLVLEIAAVSAPGASTVNVQAEPPSDCLIGERLRRML